MGFPIYRPRRLRATENLRSMIRETELSVKDLIYPLFVVPGTGVKNEIESLPGNYHWSLDRLPEVLQEISEPATLWKKVRGFLPFFPEFGKKTAWLFV